MPSFIRIKNQEEKKEKNTQLKHFTYRALRLSKGSQKTGLRSTFKIYLARYAVPSPLTYPEIIHRPPTVCRAAEV